MISTTITLRGVRHFTSEEAMSDVLASHERHEEISDATAATIASWWQSSGTIGAVLAALASGTPVTVADLLDDIARTRAADRPTGDDDRALDMLATWALSYGDVTA